MMAKVAHDVDLQMAKRQLTGASGKCLDLQNLLTNLLKLDVLYEAEAVLIVSTVSNLRQLAGKLYDRSTKLKAASYDFREPLE
jgi:hypothetical protein